MQTGKVLLFNEDKGFGFIEAQPLCVFFHSTSVTGALPRPGDLVEYEAHDVGKKSPQAVAVRIAHNAARAAAEALFQ